MRRRAWLLLSLPPLSLAVSLSRSHPRPPIHVRAVCKSLDLKAMKLARRPGNDKKERIDAAAKILEAKKAAAGAPTADDEDMEMEWAAAQAWLLSHRIGMARTIMCSLRRRSCHA